MLDQGVPFASLALVLGSLSGDSDSDSPGEVPDTLVPNELVELGVDPHVLGLHHLGDEILDAGESLGGFSFKLSFVCQLVNVYRCVDCCLTEALPLFFFTHSHSNIQYIN